MFRFKENDLGSFRKDFETMVLTDKVIIALFLIASQFDNDNECPTFWGNLEAFIDIKGDDWLIEKWESFQHDEELYLDVKERLEIVRQNIVEELKALIPDEVVY